MDDKIKDDVDFQWHTDVMDAGSKFIIAWLVCGVWFAGWGSLFLLLIHLFPSFGDFALNIPWFLWVLFPMIICTHYTMAEINRRYEKDDYFGFVYEFIDETDV